MQLLYEQLSNPVCLAGSKCAGGRGGARLARCFEIKCRYVIAGVVLYIQTHGKGGREKESAHVSVHSSTRVFTRSNVSKERREKEKEDSPSRRTVAAR